MAKDYTALTTFLDAAPAFDAEVRNKSLQPLIAKLNSPEAGQTGFQVVSSDDVLEAIGNGVRSLTAQQLQRLQLFTSREEVDFNRQRIRGEMRDIFSGNTAVLDRLQALASRTKNYCEAFGFDSVSKRDLWKVLPNISKSYMAEYLARG